MPKQAEGGQADGPQTRGSTKTPGGRRAAGGGPSEHQIESRLPTLLRAKCRSTALSTALGLRTACRNALGAGACDIYSPLTAGALALPQQLCMHGEDSIGPRAACLLGYINESVFGKS